MMVSYNGLLILLIAMSISNGALADDDATCPMISHVSCPTMTSPDSDDVIQMVPKRLPRDHPLADRAEMAGIDLKLICAKPDCLSNPCLHGGTCKETYDGYECHCLGCTFGNHCEELFKDCSEIYAAGQRTSGVYQICLVAEEPIDVLCKLESAGWLEMHCPLTTDVNSPLKIVATMPMIATAPRYMEEDGGIMMINVTMPT